MKKPARLHPTFAFGKSPTPQRQDSLNSGINSRSLESSAFRGLIILVMIHFLASSALAVPDGCTGPDDLPFTMGATDCPVPSTPPSFSVPSLDDDGIYTITWGSATHSPSHYELYEKVGENPAWSLVHSHSSQSKTLAGRSNGYYSYQARACNAYGCGSYTETMTINVSIPYSSPPGIPASLTVPEADEDGTYTVAWGAANGEAIRYELYEMAGAGPWLLIANTLGLSKGVSGRDGNVYSYKVRACNSLGCSDYTEIKAVRVACSLDLAEDCQPHLAELELLTLNTWLISPPLGIGAGEYRTPRAKALNHLFENVFDYDIIALQETFDDDASIFIFSDLEQKYPEQVRGRPIGVDIWTNGGLSLLSKFPSVSNSSVSRHNQAFDYCFGVDCFARKGFTYNRLQLENGVVIGVVNTHLNAGEGDGDKVARWFQLQELWLWITLNHPREIPIIYMGDFNIHGANGVDSGFSEYNAIANSLGDTLRDVWLESYGDSMASNNSCGDDFADPGYTFYPRSVDSSFYSGFSGICPRNETSPGDPNRRFDYIFVDQGTSPYHIEVSPPKTTRWFAPVCFNILGQAFFCGEAGTYVGSRDVDMSDHFGLETTIRVYPSTVTRPVSDFSAAVEYLSATFTDLSESGRDIISWRWRFGDGNVSASQHPSHTYASGGTYLVHLTVTDVDGLSDTFSGSVTVISPLEVSSILGPSIVDPGENGTWHVNVSGGEGPLTHQWFVSQTCFAKGPTTSCGEISFGDIGPSLTTSLTSSSTLKVIVTDHSGASITRTKEVTVY